MSKFLAFAYDSYYPSGGSGDFFGAFETFEEAQTAALAEKMNYAEVYDVATQSWRSIETPPCGFARHSPKSNPLPDVNIDAKEAFMRGVPKSLIESHARASGRPCRED